MGVKDRRGNPCWAPVGLWAEVGQEEKWPLQKSSPRSWQATEEPCTAEVRGHSLSFPTPIALISFNFLATHQHHVGQAKMLGCLHCCSCTMQLHRGSVYTLKTAAVA